MLPVVILCGGLGTRLRPVVEDRPKAMVPVDGTPFLAYLLEQLEDEGVEEIILSTGHLGEQIEAFVDRTTWAPSVECIREEEPLGTGGALRYVAETADLDAFVAMNGDTLFNGSVKRLVRFHAKQDDPAASIALVQTDQPDRYGRVRFDESTGQIQGFDEKQSGIEGTVWINAGVYVLEPAVWTAIEEGETVSLEREVFPAWGGESLYGCRFPDADFLDIGTPEDYRKAEAWLTQNWAT
jgi:NDP-sugar pyrophosphorylase family protein